MTEKYLYIFLSIVFLVCLPIYINGAVTVILPDTDVGTCYCDLTPNVCDIRCCCDPSCSASDRLTFSSCADVYTSPDPLMCTYTSIQIYMNTISRTTNTSGSIFCLTNDNYISRNFYVVQPLINSTNTSGVQAIVNNEQAPTFTVSSVPWTAATNYTTYYKEGDPIYTYYQTDIFGRFSLPYGQGSDLCSIDTPAVFLKPWTSTCSRTFTSLSTSCESDANINLKTFTESFKIANNPVVLQSIINKSPTSGNLTAPVAYNDSSLLNITGDGITCLDQYGNPVTENCSFALSTPVYDSATFTCSKMLKSIMYTFVFSGTNGLSRVGVRATLVTMSVNNTKSIQQSFSTSFTQNATNEVPRSGNPGYLIGKPILAGNRSTINGNLYVQLSTNPSNWLTTISSGTCNMSLPRVPVTFGDSISSSCTIPIGINVGERCSYLEGLIKQTLTGPSPPNVIATFGNSSPSKPGDWVDIFNINADLGAVNSQAGATARCSSIITGARLSVLYASVGNQLNPQYKIVGAKMEFFKRSISFNCIGTVCIDPVTRSQATQLLRITMDVEFIDVSSNATAVEKSKPVFLARLPYDFFYPFFVDDGARFSSSLLVHVFCLAVLFFIRKMS